MGVRSRWVLGYQRVLREGPPAPCMLLDLQPLLPHACNCWWAAKSAAAVCHGLPAATVAAAEEAVPLRERDVSPPRQRSSPTRMAAVYAQPEGQGLLRQFSRESAEWHGNGRPLARRSAADLR
jgi:hypothetical protein